MPELIRIEDVANGIDPTIFTDIQRSDPKDLVAANVAQASAAVDRYQLRPRPLRRECMQSGQQTRHGRTSDLRVPCSTHLTAAIRPHDHIFRQQLGEQLNLAAG